MVQLLATRPRHENEQRQNDVTERNRHAPSR
jgi:hypothetical protein